MVLFFFLLKIDNSISLPNQLIINTRLIIRKAIIIIDIFAHSFSANHEYSVSGKWTTKQVNLVVKTMGYFGFKNWWVTVPDTNEWF